MLDADFALETTRSIPFKADIPPDPKRLFPGNRLDVIASILATVVLRSKVRKAVFSNNLGASKNLPEQPEKDLISCGNRAFIYDKRVRNFG